MNNPIDNAIKSMLNKALAELENVLNSDVLCYYGPLANGNENMMLQIVEELAQDPNKKGQLAIYSQQTEVALWLLKGMSIS